jgi:hypothetical protein
LCLQARNSRRAKIAPQVKEKSVKGADDTVVAFVVTVLT